MDYGFVYFTEKFDDGGLIEVFRALENEVKFPTKNGINLFSDEEIKSFLDTYRKTAFICTSTDPEIIREGKRLSKKFNLPLQSPN